LKLGFVAAGDLPGTPCFEDAMPSMCCPLLQEHALLAQQNAVVLFKELRQEFDAVAFKGASEGLAKSGAVELLKESFVGSFKDEELLKDVRLCKDL